MSMEKFVKLSHRLTFALIETQKKMEDLKEQQKRNENDAKEFKYLFIGSIVAIPFWIMMNSFFVHWVGNGSFICFLALGMEALGNVLFFWHLIKNKFDIDRAFHVPEPSKLNEETNTVFDHFFLFPFIFVLLPCFVILFGKYLYSDQTQMPELDDDRMPFLQSLFFHIDAWDRDIQLINRLIDQAELGLIEAKDIVDVVRRLREDEVYMLRSIEYGKRLLEEGPLGTSQWQSGNVEELADRMDDRWSAIQTHRQELQELSKRLAARIEVAKVGS